MWIIANKDLYQQKHTLMTQTCVGSVSGIVWGHKNCVHTINNQSAKVNIFYGCAFWGGGCAIGNLQEKVCITMKLFVGIVNQLV